MNTQELIEWLYINYRKLDSYFVLIFDYLLGQEFSSIPFTCMNIDKYNVFWAGNKLSCYPDMNYCTVDEFIEYCNTLFNDKETLQCIGDKLNKIPRRFELPEVFL